MKLKVLALSAAVASISCVTPCSAQLNIDSPASPHPESRLAFQNSDGGLDIFGQAPASAEVSPSDDYFAPGAPGEGLGAPRSILADQPSIFTSAPQSTPSSAAPSSPPSIPPAAAPLGVLSNTPEAGMVPVCWPDGVGGCRTPNPIADMMARNWCTDGLWATYPAQRACQCVHIQQHTGGYNRYTYGSAACGACGSPACGTCGNAYAAHTLPAPPAASFAKSQATAPVSALEAPSKPAAQLVISPVMSAPTQLPTAQTASPVQAAPVQAALPTAPAQASPAQSQPAAESLQPTSNLLPAAPLPADLPEVPVVASRPTGFFR
ncbi:MAG: hypothetical protein ACTHK7_13680 [Aureliella sp.]